MTALKDFEWYNDFHEPMPIGELVTWEDEVTLVISKQKSDGYDENHRYVQYTLLRNNELAFISYWNKSDK